MRSHLEQYTAVVTAASTQVAAATEAAAAVAKCQWYK